MTIVDANGLAGVTMPEPAHTAIRLEEPAADLPAAALQAAKKAVQAGDTVFSGKTMPLLDAYAYQCAAKTPQRPTMVFSDSAAHRELMQLLEELLPARFTGVHLRRARNRRTPMPWSCKTFSFNPGRSSSRSPRASVRS